MEAAGGLRQVGLARQQKPLLRTGRRSANLEAGADRCRRDQRGRRLVQPHRYSLRFGEGSRVQIDEDLASGDQRVDRVARHVAFGRPEEVTERAARLRRHPRQYLLFLERGYVGRGAQIVVQKLNVPLKHPVDISRGSDPVVQTQVLSVTLAGRTYPPPVVKPVAVRAALSQALKVLFGLAFLPARAIFTNHKKIRRMQNAQTPAVRRTILELDRRYLIEVLMDGLVVFEFDDRWQLDSVAFKTGS